LTAGSAAPARTTRQRAALAGLAVAAVAIHLAAAWSVPVSPLRPDYQEYRALAANLRTAGELGYGSDWRERGVLATSPWRYLYDARRSVQRVPGYPAALALLQAGGASRMRVQQAAFALLDGGSTVCIGLLGGALFGPATGLWAAGLYALSPGAAYGLTKLSRVPLLTLFFGLLLLLLVRLDRDRRASRAVLAGGCAGLGAYFKVTSLVVAVVGALWLLRGPATDRRKARLVAGLLVITAALVVSPWIVRNSMVRGHAMGLEAMSGQHICNSLDSDEWLAVQPAAVRERLDPAGAPDGYRANRRLLALAAEHVAAEPLQAARSLIRNAALFWSPVPRVAWAGAGLRSIDVAAGLYYVLVFALFLGGLWRHRREPVAWLAVALLLVMTALHAVAGGWPRYRLAFEPLLLVFAAVPLARGRAQP